jgi:hypothetical protein
VGLRQADLIPKRNESGDCFRLARAWLGTRVDKPFCGTRMLRSPPEPAVGGRFGGEARAQRSEHERGLRIDRIFLERIRRHEPSANQQEGLTSADILWRELASRVVRYFSDGHPCEREGAWHPPRS